jgi:hypothetical protein
VTSGSPQWIEWIEDDIEDGWVREN